jgi:hypothetical protein
MKKSSLGQFKQIFSPEKKIAEPLHLDKNKMNKKYNNTVKILLLSMEVLTSEMSQICLTNQLDQPRYYKIKQEPAKLLNLLLLSQLCTMNSLKVYIIGKTSKFLKSMRPFSIKN